MRYECSLTKYHSECDKRTLHISLTSVRGRACQPSKLRIQRYIFSTLTKHKPNYHISEDTNYHPSHIRFHYYRMNSLNSELQLKNLKEVLQSKNYNPSSALYIQHSHEAQTKLSHLRRHKLPSLTHQISLLQDELAQLRVTAEELERGATVKELQSQFDELSTSQETLMRRASEEEK